MDYAGQLHYAHGRRPRLGLLLTNLGTPDAPTKSALRRYLAEFLWDPRVVEVPRPIWWLILNGIILNTRPARSAAAYASVWTDEGSPLMVISERQLEGVLQRLGGVRCDVPRGEESPSSSTDVGSLAGDAPVVGALGMRYGRPSIARGLRALRQAGAERVVVLPLYPQYSAATVGSTFDSVAEALRRERWVPELHFVSGYDLEEDYIDAVADSIREYWAEHPPGECLLFSFHGVPKRYLLAGDPYHCQCHRTARLVAERLGLSPERYRVSFQSRFGREEWIKPYTDETLKAMPGDGIRSVDVVCPGFSADCLETIEEIGEENREYFMEAGGERYAYIPALNDRPAHLDALAGIVQRVFDGWRGAEAAAVAAASVSAERARVVAAERDYPLPPTAGA